MMLRLFYLSERQLINHCYVQFVFLLGLLTALSICFASLFAAEIVQRIV